MKKLIINLAPTGMVPTKKMTPYVPVSSEEIINDALQGVELGASIVHLHARDAEGVPTYKKEIYAEIIEGLRNTCPEVIIVASTSGRNFPEFSKRAEVLDLEANLKPDMASLTLSSLNFIETASINSPQTIISLAKKMKEKGIKAELEVFDLGMVNFAKQLIKKGLLDPPYYFNIFLGNIATAQATLMHTALIISELPQPCYFAIAGLGRYQKAMNALGVIAADGVRVGLEDNIWFNKEANKLATNPELVHRISELAKAYGRPIATPNEVRKMLELKEV